MINLPASTVTVSGHHGPTSKTPSNGRPMVACWAGSNSRPLDQQSDSLLIALRGLAITNFVANDILQIQGNLKLLLLRLCFNVPATGAKIICRHGQRAYRLVKPGIEPATPDYKASGNYPLVYHGDSYSKLLSAANLK